MKKFKFLFAMLLIVATTIGFTACDDDDEDDVRDQAVGNYTGKVDYYYLVNGALSPIPDVESTSITTATVSKEGSQALLLNVEGDLIKLAKVTAVSNGFVFDFDGEIQITDDDNQVITLSGYNGFKLTSSDASATSYHGGYINGKLEFFAQGTVEGYAQKVIMEFSLTKK